MSSDQPPRHRPSHAAQRVLFGLAVVAIGVLALLDNLHVFDIALLRTFWPLALVLWGVSRLVFWRHGSVMFSLVVIGIGAVLTAQNLGYTHIQLRDWWPVLIIMAGLSILLRAFIPRAGDKAGCIPATTLAHGELVSINASFSAISQRNDSPDFKGGRLSSTFGGVELDLTQAVIAGTEARLEISARFSGIELRVPREWQVVVEVDSTFGGVEDKTTPPMAGGPRLVLRGDVVFGGVEIKN
ncbi:LiaI-LiaF-like domain-containing protein [Roseateles asaccharophilus]|uniref:Membrane protein n=1 Tax=Roseateles asaccharophilus TaxID=582607 RepID=A0ABU2AFH1_9BURK|nr:DUF5668 domain-containing protein [Roseateles asaccharophilus]MDR7335961.1 putative membrane protein [Roseateles asaccharophilus]